MYWQMYKSIVICIHKLKQIKKKQAKDGKK